MAETYTYPTVTIQQMVFTAKRWGQFPTITYIPGGTAGSEVVSMDSSFNITIKLQSGVSTNAQVAAALRLAVLANHLGAGDICAAVPVTNHSTDTVAAPAVSAVAASGTVSTKAHATLQGVTMTAAANGTTLNGKILSFTPGATAGAEVVTVTSGSVSVQIQDGVSTVDDIVTALGAATPFTDLWVASGSGSTGLFADILVPLAGESVAGVPPAYTPGFPYILACTTDQKNALLPAAGVLVFDTDLAKLCVYTGSAWQTVTSA